VQGGNIKILKKLKIGGVLLLNIHGEMRFFGHFGKMMDY
jgi:hypothetical protein